MPQPQVKEVVYALADIFAAHNLFHFAKKEGSHERMRMISGATMAGLGYAFGPELEERIKHLDDMELSQTMKKQLLYTAGGVLLGSVVGYTLGPDMYESRRNSIKRRLDETEVNNRVSKSLKGADPTEESFDPTNPGGLLTIGSAGWLGYSLFLRDKTADEEKRQLWGLGAGVIGHAYGPKVIGKVKGMAIPSSVQSNAIEVYSRGSALFGAAVGGFFGMYTGRQ